ncbi:hypothetical protein CL654_01380 [bacterium]|nr:hypothetical protein [bacterium]|tara:strand:- start:16059 stop:16259 length:201 start_codon:yes stop_codon:yes gene_type:complete
MKTLKCDLCDHEAQGETFEAWMNALKPHYAEAHADFMKEKGDMSPEEQQKAMQIWMEENKKRFEDA